MPKRYKNTEILKTEEGIRYFKTTIYPEIPIDADDTYVISAGGDRYDTLAQQYYQDSSLWWIIASANPTTRFSLAIIPGAQLRIPVNPSNAVRAYDDLNKNR